MTNLLYKASIVTTPTAYGVGVLNSIKPAQAFGEELVTNGNFATDSDWTKEGAWTISGGVASVISSTNDRLYQSISLEADKKYLLSINVVSISAASVRFRFGSNGSAANLPEITTPGIHTFTSKPLGGTSSVGIFAVSGTTATIDSVSVVEVTDADFDFTRTSSATRVNPDYLIETVATDIPRLDYTNGTASILLEPASTNLINYSQAISNTPVKNGTFVDNAAISPDGTLNATKLTATTTDPFFYQNITFAAATYTSSIYVKGIGDSIGKEFRIAISSSTTAPKLIVPSEWTRFEFTATVGAGTASTGIEITDPAIVGDEVLVWGWQVEQQSYATSYIPTSGQSGGVTRAAETLNNAGNSDLINSTEGVLYAEISSLVGADNYRQITLTDGSTSDYVLIGFRNDTGNIYYQVVVNSVVQASFISTQSSINTFSKIAVKWKVNDFAIWVNGIELSSNTSGDSFVANTLNVLNFNIIGVNNFYGRCKTVAVFSEALSDTELACLTSTNNREIFLNYYYRMQYVGANTEALSCAEQTFNI